MSNRHQGPLVFWCCILILGLMGYGGFVAFRMISNSAHAADTDAPLSGKVERFTLIDQDGRDFDSKSMRGQVWATSFFFTSCPQICVQLNQALAKLQEDPRFAEVKFVSITCNPEVDRPVVLDEYSKKFKADHQRWTFLTGTLDEVNKVGAQFKVTVGKEVHSDRLVLIDRTGEIRGRFRATVPDELELIKKTLLVMLREEKKAE